MRVCMLLLLLLLQLLPSRVVSALDKGAFSLIRAQRYACQLMQCYVSCCRSAVETVKIARETIEGLFNLQVGLAEDTIQSLCAGIAECISGYARYI